MVDDGLYKPGLYNFEAKPYTWLLEHLKPDLSSLGPLSCLANIQDTAVFQNGKILFVALTTPKGHVSVKHSASKLSLHKLRLIFATKVRKRRLKTSVQAKKPFVDIGSRQALERPTTVPGGEPQTEFQYRDVALMRFKDETWQVMNDALFMSTFLKRQNDKYWLGLNYV